MRGHLPTWCSECTATLTGALTDLVRVVRGSPSFVGRPLPWAHGEDRILASVVFIDVVQSVALSREVGAAAMDGIRNAYVAGVQELVAAWGGCFVKGLDDGALLLFRNNVDAYRFAADLQEHPRHHPRPIRVGVNSGAVRVTRDDVFGLTVAFAKRLEALAPPGGLAVAECVKDEIDAEYGVKHPLPWKPETGVSVKGFEPRKFTVYRLGGPGPWRANPDEQTDSRPKQSTSG